MHYIIKYNIPSSYIKYTDSFATVQFSLENIKENEIDNIPTWIQLINKYENINSTHQINIDGSHPFIIPILNRVIIAVPSYTKLTYIHIHIHHSENQLIYNTIRKLIQAVRQHPNGDNITVHIDSNLRQIYI